MSNQFLGQILSIAFNYNPRAWAICASQLLSIQQNAALFSLLGTTYGGNGVQTFALPDLRGRYPMCWGSGPGLTPRVIGEASGTQATTMLVSNMPMHNHLMMVNNTAATAPSPSGTSPSQGPVISSTNVNVYGVVSPPTGVMAATTVGNAGSSVPFSILQPYNTINYIIALAGIFPSRN